MSKMPARQPASGMPSPLIPGCRHPQLPLAVLAGGKWLDHAGLLAIQRYQRFRIPAAGFDGKQHQAQQQAQSQPPAGIRIMFPRLPTPPQNRIKTLNWPVLKYDKGMMLKAGLQRGPGFLKPVPVIFRRSPRQLEGLRI